MLHQTVPRRYSLLLRKENHGGDAQTGKSNDMIGRECSKEIGHVRSLLQEWQQGH